jgi:adenine-specific DNA methylase
MYYFWVKEIDCVSCEESVSLFKDYRVGKGRYGNDGYDVHCPECGEISLTEDWHSETICGNDSCRNKFVPDKGNVPKGGKYACPKCGQKYGITDAIQEQGGFETRLFALEYYCPTCDKAGHDRQDVKGYRMPRAEDFEATDVAYDRWKNDESLRKYIPGQKIRKGSKTESSSVDGSDVFAHGYRKWSDMFNDRQLLCLSKLLRAIDDVEDNNAREYLLMTFSNVLSTNSTMVPYQTVANKIDHIFRSNSFDPPMTFAENNLWGTEFGRGTFSSMWSMLIEAVEYAHSPTDRHMEDGQMVETPPFDTPIGENATVTQGDSRKIDAENEFDAVLTDPPYYDNIIYSELSDYFYVWLKLLLEDEYESFEYDHTPRAESIVANPAENKDVGVFESELHESFDMMHTALKQDGVLAFTYHHSDSESWGELLQALCDVGFQVTATYPITSDIIQLVEGETVEFDIIIVARPIDDRQPISWDSLRRNIVRTAKQTHQRLTETRELSDGNIGVIEMGRAFKEYSKHHGQVRRDGDIMDAKEVVAEIYGIIQQGSDIGEVDVFLDLLEMDEPSYTDMNMLTRGTSANPEKMKKLRLYRMEGGEFVLGTWDESKRSALIQEQVNGEAGEHLPNLAKLQFLRHRYEGGKAVQNYINMWGVDDGLRELAGELADATGDETYKRVLGDRDITAY